MRFNFRGDSDTCPCGASGFQRPNTSDITKVPERCRLLSNMLLNDFARSRYSAPIRPSLADLVHVILPFRARDGQHRAKLGRTRHKLDNSGRVCPTSDQHRPTLVDAGQRMSILANICQHRATMAGFVQILERGVLPTFANDYCGCVQMLLLFGRCLSPGRVRISFGATCGQLMVHFGTRWGGDSCHDPSPCAVTCPRRAQI